MQKGIQTDTNNLQPRIGLAWTRWGDGKTVIRSSYGVFYDHPLLGLYFLGDASDGSKSGQLLFFGANPGCNSAVPPLSLTATNIFQGIAGDCFPQAVSAFGYEANQQRFNSFLPNSQFINQGYITNGIPLISQPFGYPQSKNFVYAYSQQVNLTVERDLGDNYSLSLAYNFNGGRHLNRPINANTSRGDLLVANWQAAVAAGAAAPTDSPLSVASCGANPIPGSKLPYFVPSAFGKFLPAVGLEPFARRRILALPRCSRCRFASQWPQCGLQSGNAGELRTFQRHGRELFQRQLDLPTDSPPIYESGSIITTKCWPPTPGRIPSMTRLTCNRLWLRRTVIILSWSAQIPCLISVTALYSVPFIRVASLPAAGSRRASSVTGLWRQ